MPDQPPRTTYEGATMPKKKEWGIQDEVGMPKENVGGMPKESGMPKGKEWGMPKENVSGSVE